MRPTLLLWFLLTLFMTCPVMGQVSKQALTEADYGLWHKLYVEQLSDGGNWASYGLQYESGMDTLFVKHTKTLKTYAFAKGCMGRFAKERFFICQSAEGTLVVTNLASGKQEQFAGVSSYELSSNGRFLIAQRTIAEQQPELLMKDLEGNYQEIIPNVSVYSYDAKANAVVCDSGDSLLCLSLGNRFKKIVISTTAEGVYSNLVWQSDGASVAFFYWDNSTKIGYYRIKEQRLFTFDPESIVAFPKEAEIYHSSFSPLTISDDGGKVFFGVKDTAIEEQSTGVQIWNTADRDLYPKKRLWDGGKVVPKLAVWFPKGQRFSMLTDNEYSHIQLTGDQKHALVYNPLAHEPQFEYKAPLDIYLKTIDTGEQKLVIAQLRGDEGRLSVSKDGRYIAYFKDKHWWVYDIKMDRHRNLTATLGVSMQDEHFDRSGEKWVCGMAGWTADGSGLLLYDTYDVWLLKTDGSSCRRLTQGREQQLVYRLVPMHKENRRTINFSGMRLGFYDLADGFYLKATGATSSGYFKWSLNKGLGQMVHTNNRIDHLLVSNVNDVVLYTEEHYHLSPKLMVLHKGKSQGRQLFQSNAQQQRYEWSFSRLITYENAKGQELKGALFYPAGYDADQTYPMVVKVYERQSAAYNQYENPSVFNSEGFNISNFTAKGYFVLLPDIVYDEGDTGRSALDCVVGACNEVLEHESVDPKRLGLFGHSFGGYETNFIITQTKLFASAIAGAGVSDYVSDYFSVLQAFGKPNYFRYEFDQSRMGVSLFDDRERYARNSPLTYLENVETPLLTWSGTGDKTVHYFQSLTFHLALKRLQKPNLLVLYDGESHSLGQKKNRKDLTKRFEDWFDYYLKGGAVPQWMQPNQL